MPFKYLVFIHTVESITSFLGKLHVLMEVIKNVMCKIRKCTHTIFSLTDVVRGGIYINFAGQLMFALNLFILRKDTLDALDRTHSMLLRNYRFIKSKATTCKVSM